MIPEEPHGLLEEILLHPLMFFGYAVIAAAFLTEGCRALENYKRRHPDYEYRVRHADLNGDGRMDKIIEKRKIPFDTPRNPLGGYRLSEPFEVEGTICSDGFRYRQVVRAATCPRSALP